MKIHLARRSAGLPATLTLLASLLAAPLARAAGPLPGAGARAFATPRADVASARPATPAAPTSPSTERVPEHAISHHATSHQAWVVADRGRAASAATTPSQLDAPKAVTLTAGLGYARSYGSSFDGGVGPELSLGGRLSIFELGLRADYLTSLGPSRLGLGGYGGMGWHARDFSLSMQGELGAHDYRKVGSGLMTDDPGAGGSTGFVGARTSFDLRLHGGRHVTPVLGAAISLRHDLSQERVTYSYQETPWLDLSGHAQPQQRSTWADIGAAAALGFMFHAGIEID